MSETPESSPASDTPTMPRTARMAMRIGTFAPAAAIFGILLIHVGLIPPMGGFMFFQIALLCALVAVPLGIAALIITRNQTEGPGRTAALMGMAAAAVVITVTVIGAGDGTEYPPINDITTNLEDPPAFADPSDVPDFAGRDMSYPEDFVEIVRTSYPALATIELPEDRDETFERALAAAEALGWEVVHKDESAGTINARETTSVFKFVDDVVIRVRSDGTGSVVDVRSKSRDGRGDLGANAKRIGRFATALRG